MEYEKLRSDMIAALKAHDMPKKEVISSLVAAVKKAAIDSGARDDIKPELVDQVILKELKTAKEQLDTCPESRQDLKTQYKFLYDVIASYAPKMMSDDEIRAFLAEHCAAQIAAKDKGGIMKAVMGALKGKADGKDINRIAMELCR